MKREGEREGEREGGVRGSKEGKETRTDGEEKERREEASICHPGKHNQYTCCHGNH